MMPSFYKPRRRLRKEILPLVVVCAFILSLVSIFPMKAITRASQSTVGQPALVPSCQFITLTPKEEAAALLSARAAWAVNTKGAQNLRIEMFAAPLPESAPIEVLEFRGKGAAERQNEGATDYKPSLTPGTLAAPAPQPILSVPEEDATPQTFSREDLLKLDQNL